MVSLMAVGKLTPYRWGEEDFWAWRTRARTPRVEGAYCPDADEQPQMDEELRPQGC